MLRDFCSGEHFVVGVGGGGSFWRVGFMRCNFQVYAKWVQNMCVFIDS